MFPVCPFVDAKGNGNCRAKKLQIHRSAEIPCENAIIAIISIDTLVSICFPGYAAFALGFHPGRI
jgi:hypothetical protein